MTVAARVRSFNRRRTTGAYFVGYPKSGNTWARFLVARYLQRICGDDSLVLFDGYDRWGRCQRACKGPAMHFTHAPLTWGDQTAAELNRDSVVSSYEGRPIVLIARYPLDVLVSLWMQRRHRADSRYDGPLTEFVADPVFGLDKLLRFHRLWAAEQNRPAGLHLLRYEDLRSDADTALRAVLAFLGIPIEDDAVVHAVEAASFESMRRLEESGQAPTYRSSGASVFATGDPSNPDALHLRRGTVGGYAEHLEPDDARRLETRISEELPAWYGYLAPPKETTHVA